MLIQAFEQVLPNTSRPAFIFRGRDSYFWKRNIFKNIEPFDPNRGEQAFHFLMVFDPESFPAMDTHGVDEFFKLLETKDPSKDNIFSIADKPFYAISRGAFEKLKFDLSVDADVTVKLKNNRNVRQVSLEQNYTVLNVNRNFRMVEHMVTVYQLEVLFNAGVTVEDMGNFYFEGLPTIGEGSVIGSGVVIKGDCSIGKHVTIYPHCFIENTSIGDNCILLPGCVLRDSALEEDVQIGPYAHLRNGATAKKGSKMGNFVEMKKSVLGEGSKAMHLTYIGDAEIGRKVNIGAGTITCNYDGVNKNKTHIEDGVFIGSGTELVAPVTIKQNSYVAAGSTITEDVQEFDLAVARQKQRNIPGWVQRKNRKKS